LLLN
jgi:hypothetical protein